MALRINHNIASLNANRNLGLTSVNMEKSMQKLSSGYRINVAADDPAGLVISEQFRAQVAGLNRAIQNSEGSITMIQTAEGALTEINNLLISMRELAIHAGNEGFNDADQLAADQAEIENAIKTIDRIAATTQFGTKKLLDGSKENVASITSNDSTGLTIKNSGLSSGTHYVTTTKTADSTSSLNVQNLGLSLSNTDGDPVNLTSGVHNIDVVQSSAGAEKISGTVTSIGNDAFGNAFTVAGTATQASIVSGGAIAAVTAGVAGSYTYYVNFQENGGSATGVQSLTIDAVVDDVTADFATKLTTAIGNNAALAGKVQAVDGGAGVGLKLQAVNEGTQYSIQTLATTTTATAAAANSTLAAADARGVSLNVLNFDWNTSAGANVGTAVTLAAASYADMDALVAALNVGIVAAADVAVGGTDEELYAEVYDTNKIRFATRDEGSLYTLTTNAGTAGTSNLRSALNLSTDVAANTGTDAVLTLDGYTNTINRVDWAQSTTTKTLENAALTDSDRGTVTMSVGNAQTGINAGSMLLSVTAAQFDVRLDGGPATSVSGGTFGSVFNSDRSESLQLMIDLTSSGGTETINSTDQSLVFQIGANVGQTESISLRNMSATALGKNIVDNLFNDLSKIDVTTTQGAQDSQSVIDAAINEVSTTRGTLGSFQKNTLESNLRNLRIASQNLQASESQIRDTDMAMEMSNFTQAQILMQAGVAMISQANQAPQVVLSLF